MNLRRSLLPWHRRLGLAAALLVVVQALSGSLLVFRWELGRVLDPSGMVRRSAVGAGDAPLGSILQALQSAYPAYRLQRLGYPDVPAATYIAHLQAAADGTRHYVSLDPGDAAVLREGGIWRFPAEAILELHYRLLAGTAGQCVVVLTGVLLLAMLASGLVNAWPRPGQWRSSLRIEPRSPRLLRQLHRNGGLVAAPVLALSVVTGLTMALELAIDALRMPVAPAGVPASLGAIAIEPMVRAERLAREQFPHNALRELRLPDPATARFLFRAPEHNATAVHEVRVDPGDLTVRALIPAAGNPALWSPLLPWHTGRALALPGRVLIAVGGLVLTALAVIGPWMWWRARTARRRPAEAALRSTVL